jgi:hypothetical protein
MLDLGHLPARTRTHISKFTRPATADTQWETWRKPRGITHIHILCIGGGASGAGGQSVAGADNGGGGGGSSGQAVVTIPAHLLPDILHIQAGAGGAAVALGTNGNVGALSYVAVYPNLSASNCVAVSAGTVPTGGVSAAGTAGAAGSIPTIGIMPRALLGNFNLIAGQAGTAGASGAAGTDIAIPVTGCCCMGGSAGGGVGVGTQFAGGAVTAIADTLLSAYRPQQAAATVAGSGGPQLWQPFFSFGGLGGGGHDTATAGDGGPGAYGAGGGGGGAGTTGGAGGSGGNGIVIITAW